MHVSSGACATHLSNPPQASFNASWILGTLLPTISILKYACSSLATIRLDRFLLSFWIFTLYESHCQVIHTLVPRSAIYVVYNERLSALCITFGTILVYIYIWCLPKAIEKYIKQWGILLFETCLGYSSHDDYSSDEKQSSRARRDKGIHIVKMFIACLTLVSWWRYDISMFGYQ